MHDSTILRIEVHRQSDKLSIDLDYIVCYEPIRSAPKTLVFEDCAWTEITMHLFCAPPDSIDSVEEFLVSEEIDRLRRFFQKSGSDFQDYVHYVFKTSSGSKISIVARNMYFIDSV